MFAKESDVETEGNYSLGHLYNTQLLAHLSDTPVVGTRLYQLCSHSCGHAARYLQSLLHLLVLQAECSGLLLQHATVGATLLGASHVTTSTYKCSNLKFQQLFAVTGFSLLPTHFGVLCFQRTNHFAVQRLCDGVLLALQGVLVVTVQSETQTNRHTDI